MATVYILLRRFYRLLRPRLLLDELATPKQLRVSRIPNVIITTIIAELVHIIVIIVIVKTTILQ